MASISLCGFCGAKNTEIDFLIAGPDIGVGSCCIPRLEEVKEIQELDPSAKRPDLPKKEDLFSTCAFCSDVKRGDEKVVGSERIPGVLGEPVICYACIEVSATILKEQYAARDGGS